MKKSFLIHTDSLAVLEALTNEQAGELFKAIKAYQDGNEDIKLNGILQVAFIPFQKQFERDKEKYNTTIERNKINGNKGGRPKKTQKTQSVISKPTQTQKTQVVLKKTDNDNAGQEEKTHSLQKYIAAELKNVSKLKNQLTYSECETLTSKYPKKLIHAKLQAMENKVDLTKKYASVYLTLNNWCKEEHKEESLGLIGTYPPGTNPEYIKIKERELRLTMENIGK
jgi:hypothetical protein